jgi:hypothetical protein
LISAALTTPTIAQEGRRVSTEELRAQCIDNSSERLGALVARDWPQLIRLATRDIRLCKSVYGSEEISRLQGLIALAQGRMGNAREALQVADLCIRTYYSNTSCHLERSRSLFALRRLEEANRSTEVTRRLIEHARQDAKERIDRLENSSSKELWTSRLDLLDSEAEALEAIAP